MSLPSCRTVLRLGSAALLLSAWCSSLWACVPSAGWDFSVQARFKAAAYVLHARVLSVEENSESGRTVANIQVLEVFKGSNPPIAIWSRRNNSCGISFTKGEENVFFVADEGYVTLHRQPFSTTVPEVLRQLRTQVQTQ